jgi:hypothetical protein
MMVAERPHPPRFGLRHFANGVEDVKNRIAAEGNSPQSGSVLDIMRPSKKRVNLKLTFRGRLGEASCSRSLLQFRCSDGLRSSGREGNFITTTANKGVAPLRRPCCAGKKEN